MQCPRRGVVDALSKVVVRDDQAPNGNKYARRVVGLHRRLHLRKRLREVLGRATNNPLLA